MSKSTGKTIAIDLDHTLVDGSVAIPGAKEAINKLRERGHKIMIHTCNNVKWAEKVLNDNDIRYDYIWNQVGKPPADCYVDDRGVRFTNWTDTYIDIGTMLGDF